MKNPTTEAIYCKRQTKTKTKTKNKNLSMKEKPKHPSVEAPYPASRWSAPRKAQPIEIFLTSAPIYRANTDR
jgi:hypothetical protein